MTEAAPFEDERQEFYERRATGIGATDSPKILGLSKRGTALSVYREKVEPDPVREQSLPAWLGSRIQDVVSELYAAQMELKVRADNRHHRHPQHSWMVCHLDYRVWGAPQILVECKTRAYMTGWGENTGDRYDASVAPEIPPDIWVQCQHELAVTGAQRCDVAVLFGHHTFRVYYVHRDDQFIETLIRQLEQFWLLNVEARVPPAPSGSDIDDAILRRDHPTDDGEMLPATPELDGLARALRLAKQNLAQIKETAAGLQHRLEEAIGDHAGIRGAFGEITWKKSKDSTETNWEAVAAGRATLLNELYDLARKQAMEDDPDGWRRVEQILVDSDTLQSIHTVTTPGSRRFLTKFREQEA